MKKKLFLLSFFIFLFILFIIAWEGKLHKNNINPSTKIITKVEKYSKQEQQKENKINKIEYSPLFKEYTGENNINTGSFLTLTGNTFTYPRNFTFTAPHNIKIGLARVNKNKKHNITSLDFYCKKDDPKDSLCITVNIIKNLTLPKYKDRSLVKHYDFPPNIHKSHFYFYNIPEKKSYCNYFNSLPKKNIHILEDKQDKKIILDSQFYDQTFVGYIGGACIIKDNIMYELLIGTNYIGGYNPIFTKGEITKSLKSFKIIKK